MAPAQRILLVEDDPDQASLFSNVLTLAGYEVVTALDAEVAIKRMIESAFDLVLVDWDLPGMKGDAFIIMVKAHYPHVRTVLYSNHSNVNEAAIACGADAWVRKSEGILRLREVVADQLSRV